MSKSTLSQYDILSGIELLSEDDQKHIQQKVKIAFHHLVEHVNCTTGTQDWLNRDLIIEYTKLTFADESISTSIDELLRPIPSIHFDNFQEFMEMNIQSYTGRNAWVRSLSNRLEHVFANVMPDESFNSKQFTYITFTYFTLSYLTMTYNAQIIIDEGILLPPEVSFEEKIEKFTHGLLGLVNCEKILIFLKNHFSQTFPFGETQNIVNVFVSIIEDRDSYLFLLAKVCGSPATILLENFFSIDLELPSFLFLSERNEAATLALDVLKTKSLQVKNQFSNTKEVSKTCEMIKKGSEKIRLDEISEQLNQHDKDATVLVYQIDSNGILHCCLLNGDVKLFTFPQVDKNILISQMQMLLKPCGIQLPRSVSFFNHIREDIHTLNNTSDFELSHNRYPAKKKKKSETESPLQTATSKLKNLNAKWATKSLYTILLKPLRDFFQGNKLIIIPDQHLFCLPFSSLVDENDNSLSMNFKIQIVPTLHYLLSSLSNTVDPESIGPAMFVGNPNLDYISRNGNPLMPPLPHATEEAMQLAKLFKINPIIEDEATKLRVCLNLEQVSIFHVASHAEPTFGWIYLAPDLDYFLADVIPTQAYVLREVDLRGLDITQVRLVFLSCCNTGRGEVTSDGIFGMARAFLSAGARSVIVTLWSVDDLIAREFTHKFYTFLCEEKSVCESLQLTMIQFQSSENQNHKMAKHWAPFQILGEDIRFTKKELETIHGLGTPF